MKKLIIAVTAMLTASAAVSVELQSQSDAKLVVVCHGSDGGIINSEVIDPRRFGEYNAFCHDIGGEGAEVVAVIAGP